MVCTSLDKVPGQLATYQPYVRGHELTISLDTILVALDIVGEEDYVYPIRTDRSIVSFDVIAIEISGGRRRRWTSESSFFDQSVNRAHWNPWDTSSYITTDGFTEFCALANRQILLDGIWSKHWYLGEWVSLLILFLLFPQLCLLRVWLGHLFVLH